MSSVKYQTHVTSAQQVHAVGRVKLNPIKKNTTPNLCACKQVMGRKL